MFHLIYTPPDLWTEFTCLQCVNICCVFVGDISFEVKTEAESNDIIEYPLDDKPSTGMIVFIMSVFYVPRLNWCLCHSITCISRNMSFYPSVQRFCLSLILNTGPVSMFIHSFHQYQIILLCYRGNGLLEGFYIQQRRDPDLVRDPDPGFIYRNFHHCSLHDRIEV